MTQMSVHRRQHMHLIQVAEHLGVNSQRPRHLGLNVQEDGGRKMPHFCCGNTAPQTLMASSVQNLRNLPEMPGTCHCMGTATSTSTQVLQLRQLPTMMPSITGVSTTEGSTARPASHHQQNQPCTSHRCRRGRPQPHQPRSRTERTVFCTEKQTDLLNHTDQDAQHPGLGTQRVLHPHQQNQPACSQERRQPDHRR